MGALGIFNKILKRGSAETTNYLAITLTSDKILASIWRVDEDSQISIVGHSEKEFHSIDSLINEAAVAIDSAAKNIDTDVNQVVFGLSNYWFENGSPSKETTDILKNLSQELELDAQAFVPISASVGHYFKLKTGSADTVCVGQFKDYTEVSLVEGGNFQTKEIKDKASAEDIIHQLKKLKEESAKPLPTLVVFFGDGAEHLHKELAKEKKHEIFEEHTKFEALKSEDLAACVVYSQAADVLGKEPKIAAHAAGHAAVSTESKKRDETEDIHEEKQSHDPNNDDFDFQEGKDVLEEQSGEGEQSNIVEVAPAKIHEKDEYAVEVTEASAGRYESPAEKLHESTHSQKRSPLDGLLTLNWLPSLLKGGNKKKLLITGAVAIAGIFIAIYILGYTITSAQVLIKANSKPLEDDFDVTVASGAALDVTRSRIPGEETSAVVTETTQGDATGTKKTGNEAKGEVKVFNWTTSKVNFNQGTVLISKSGVKFEIDSAIEIASRSASTPGETSVGLTAQEFGTNGNVPGGTEFTFQQHDELLYSAKNDNAFTGGDEKEITVVTKEDHDELTESLEESLVRKAKDELSQKVGGQSIQEDAIEIIVRNKQFSAQIDEEASDLSLTMEVEASALSYKEETLKELLAQIAQENASENLEAKPDNIDILDVEVTQSKGNLNLEGIFRANLVPKIDEENIKDQIAGKSQKSARELIKQNPEVSEVDFKFSPSLIIFSSLPKNKDKISVKIEAVK